MQLLLAAAALFLSSVSTDGKLRVEDYVKLSDKRERGHRSLSLCLSLACRALLPVCLSLSSLCHSVCACLLACLSHG